MQKGITIDNLELEENAKKYYRKILTINLNLCLRKLPEKFKIVEWIHRKIESNKKKTEGSHTKEDDSTFAVLYAHQIIDMSLVGMVNLMPDDKSKHHKKERNAHDAHADIFAKLFRSLKTISEVAK
jgi:hypothetical protein